MEPPSPPNRGASVETRLRAEIDQLRRSVEELPNSIQRSIQATIDGMKAELEELKGTPVNVEPHVEPIEEPTPPPDQKSEPRRSLLSWLA